MLWMCLKSLSALLIELFGGLVVGDGAGLFIQIFEGQFGLKESFGIGDGFELFIGRIHLI